MKDSVIILGAVFQSWLCLGFLTCLTGCNSTFGLTELSSYDPGATLQSIFTVNVS
ncbi:hypothetical protein BDN71DRAFT_1440204 [Pleurotus eryngii]|uniref:Lipoprotein n=1 Tax=Pleurotus eryngii TaxID=5323 RepID=A0A9P6A7L5_PLEER|nr:hypothetical protein BDN71DRAFT_1440204 [Pleurotus eryngii]